jgi:hypothetical protein
MANPQELAKFKEATALSYQDQAKFFLNAFWEGNLSIIRDR